MHIYRTHTCNALRLQDVGETIRLSGWVHRKRDHGNVLFIDLRDHYGITQCVIETNAESFHHAESLRVESVITVTGKVVRRSPETVNAKMATGDIEVAIDILKIDSLADTLPLPVNTDQEFPEDIRLRYRFLDLRREKMHNNIVRRSAIISSIRRRMIEQNFMEFQTPILTSSSPEGARDFLVPSRMHPGKFYALPQAPQQFKQLLMIAGFDRYFQIAPCFRDEDARADRSPGEFYQLDFEMAFVTQDDVFAAIEPVLHGLFAEFSSDKRVSPYPFQRISYDDSMLRYGSDKPDLRNPLLIADVTSIFKESQFTVFAQAIQQGAVVRAIPATGATAKPRSFFEKMNKWAQDQGMPGLGYITFVDGDAKGPIAKFLNTEHLQQLRQAVNLNDGDAVFFVCNKQSVAEKMSGAVRQLLGNELELIDQHCFEFCWVVDFPMYEYNEELKKIDFNHNPFSMPQGGLEALNTQEPLTIKAYQYDVVCNGIELSSGAIRNHLPEVMDKAFAIAGYGREVIEEKFGGIYNALKYGAPPHGGCAPGIDRIVMLLSDEPNLREIVAFPMNQQGQDLLMQAPNVVSDHQLRELHIRLNVPTPKVEPKVEVNVVVKP